MGESDFRRKGIREELRERLRVELNSRQQVTDEELYEMIDVCILETGQGIPAVKGEGAATDIAV